ncbi:MAG TPA: hypothetical protein VFT65_20715, partial [Candidatus Angelobacter sp.]|nr:hypothetical protein [Candidatus Angelobacter sp.]
MFSTRKPSFFVAGACKVNQKNRSNERIVTSKTTGPDEGWWWFIPVMEEQSRAGVEKDRVVKDLPEPELHLYLVDEDLAEDPLSSYRRREAAWLSLVTHGVIIGLIMLMPRWVGRQAVIIPVEKQQTTMLTLPDDLQNVEKPKTNILSDKNRRAQSSTPSIDKDTLRKLMDARRPGAPKQPQSPPAQQAV